MVFLNVAMRLKDEAGNTYTLLPMAEGAEEIFLVGFGDHPKDQQLFCLSAVDYPKAP